MYDFKFNNDYKKFECNIELNENKVIVSISDFDEKSAEQVSKLANKVITWFKINKDNVLEHAASEELINLKNDVWLEEDEENITKAEFMQRLVLESISIYADGNFEVWYGDGDIFWGHAVRVDVSEGFEFLNSDMM